MEKSFKTFGIITGTSRVVLNHLARTLHKLYERLCEDVKDDGYIVAYDGMKIEL